jgi:hypothetical protein
MEVHTISSDECPRRRGKEAANAEMASTAEGPVVPVLEVPSAREASAIVRVGADPHTWGSSRVMWQDRADPEGRPVLVLDDAEEAGQWTSF